MLYTIAASIPTQQALLDLSADVYNAQLNRSINSIDKLSFSLPHGSAGFGTMPPLLTEVWLYRNEETEFHGRVLTAVPTMTSGGEVTYAITCEGQMGYLKDSVQPYTPETLYEDTEGGTTGLEKFLDVLLANHNSQVEQKKRIHRGNVNVQTNESNNQVFKGLNWASTWDTIQDKLISSYGGEIRLRESDGVLYLDYMQKIGSDRSTTIELAKNQRSLQQTLDPADVITRLYPLGAKLKATDESGNEQQTDERLTILHAADAGGVEYIDSDGGIELYGVRCGTVTWDDITDQDNLYRAAMFYLTRQNLVLASHALEAVDLSYLDIDPDGIVLGDWYPVINTVLGINTTLEVTALTVDLSKPWCPSITLGAKSVNLNDILAGGLSEKAREQVDSAISSGSAANNEILAMIQNEQRENSETLDEVANTQTLMSTAFLIDPEGNEADLLFDKILVSTTGDGTERERATAYIRFIDGNIVLGKTDNPYTMELTEQELVFMQNGVRVAWFNNDQLVVTNGDFRNSLKIGKFQFTPRDNGNLSFAKVDT